MHLLHTFSFLPRTAKIILLSFFFFPVNPLYSQVIDTVFIENMYTKGTQYIQSNPDSASWYFEKAKKESESSKYFTGLVKYHNSSAAILISSGQNEKALEYYDRAIAIAKNNNLNTDLGITYMKKGTLCQFMGENARATEFYLAAASLLTSNEERKKIIGLYKNILSTYNNLQQQNQSLQNVLPALENENTGEKEIAYILSQKKTNETSLDFPDQTTLAEISGGKIYVIFGGAKFYLPDLNVLSKYSNFRNIRKIPDGMLSRIPDIPVEGTIISQSDESGKIYLVKDKKRHHIQNPEVLQFFGGFDAVCTVPEHALDQVPDAGDTVTMQNVSTTFNFRKEYEVLIDTLKNTLSQHTRLLGEVGKKLKEKNNKLQNRKILLWTFLVGMVALSCIGILSVRNFRQKQKLHRQSILTMKAEEELRKNIAVEKERTRIASDMHDDLGAGLSKIRFLSETVQRNIRDEDHQSNLQNIANSSVELVDKFNEIIWAMNEKNNSLEDLLYYIRSYTAKYCEENGLAYKINIPENIPSRIISGEMRRHLFLTVKESLHNVVKHAEAKNVRLMVQLDSFITITIHDDGKGFDPVEMKNAGNGLRNMEQRIKSLNGKLLIENEKGTLLKIVVPFPLS